MPGSEWASAGQFFHQRGDDSREAGAADRRNVGGLPGFAGGESVRQMEGEKENPLDGEEVELQFCACAEHHQEHGDCLRLHFFLPSAGPYPELAGADDLPGDRWEALEIVEPDGGVHPGEYGAVVRNWDSDPVFRGRGRSAIYDSHEEKIR